MMMGLVFASILVCSCFWSYSMGYKHGQDDINGDYPS